MKTPPRHITLPGALYRDARVNLLDHKLLAFIGSHLDSNGWLQATTTELGAAVGKSRALANQRLVKLVERGYLAMRGDAGVRAWRVILDPSDEHVADVVTSSPLPERVEIIQETQCGENLTSGEDITKTGEKFTTSGEDVTSGENLTSPPTPPTKNLPSETTSLRESCAQAKFDELWRAYPHSSVRSRRRKPPALKAFRKLLREGVDADALISAAMVFRASDEATRDDGQFTPMLSSWLNQGGYEPWLEDEQAPDWTPEQWRQALRLEREDGWDHRWPPKERCPPEIAKEFAERSLFET